PLSSPAQPDHRGVCFTADLLAVAGLRSRQLVQPRLTDARDGLPGVLLSRDRADDSALHLDLLHDLDYRRQKRRIPAGRSRGAGVAIRTRLWKVAGGDVAGAHAGRPLHADGTLSRNSNLANSRNPDHARSGL